MAKNLTTTLTRDGVCRPVKNAHNTRNSWQTVGVCDFTSHFQSTLALQDGDRNDRMASLSLPPLCTFAASLWCGTWYTV